MNSLTDEEKSKIEEEERYREEVRSKMGSTDEGEKWYHGNLAIVALLILFFPIGLYLMWKYADWNKKVKWAVTGFFALIVIMTMASDSPENVVEDSPETAAEETTTEMTETPEEVEDDDNIGSSPLEDPEVQEYSDSMVEISSRVSEAMQTRSEIALEWPDWSEGDVIEYAAAGVVIQQSYEDALELDPPELFEDVHSNLVEGLRLWSEAVDISNEGIGEYDADKITEGTQLLERGSAYVNRATEMTYEIIDQYSE